jgi:DNA-binding transcriptional LysR family regulator
VGFTPLVGAPRISALVRRLREVQPSVDVVLVETSNDALESALDAGTLDVALGSGLRASKRRGRIVVYEDRLRLVRLWAGARPVAVELEDAARSRLLLTADLCGLATGTCAIFAAAGKMFSNSLSAKSTLTPRPVSSARMRPRLYTISQGAKQPQTKTW